LQLKAEVIACDAWGTTAQDLIAVIDASLGRIIKIAVWLNCIRTDGKSQRAAAIADVGRVLACLSIGHTLRGCTIANKNKSEATR
jgi:hypothetical protein